MGFPFGRSAQRYYERRRRALGAPVNGPPPDPPPPEGSARNDAPLTADPLFSLPTLSSPTTYVMTSSNRTISGPNSSSDIIVETNGTEIVGPCKIQNARNVWVKWPQITINGQIPNANQTSSTISTYRALAFQNITGTIFIEGMYIKPGEGLSEGVQIFGSNGATMILKNCRIAGVRSKPDDDEGYLWQHPDLVQIMCGRVRFENCSIGDSTYQGIYIDAISGSEIYEVRVRNMNLWGIRRQLFWPNRWKIGVSDSSTRRMVFQLDNLYALVNTGANTFPLQYDPGHTNVTYRLGTAQESTYPWSIVGCTLEGTVSNGWVNINDPRYGGSGYRIRRAAPPDGDFAPADKVGLNYDAAWFNTQYYV